MTSRLLTLLAFSLLALLLSMLYSHIRTMGSVGHSTVPNMRVIIVGSGLAGLSAASELVSRNVPVRILERQPKPGGNSMKASSGINGAPTRFQAAGSDSIKSFYNDTVKSVGQSIMASKTEVREELISTLASSSASAVEWLVDTHGVDLSVVAQLGGHSHARTHRGSGQTPPGASIVSTLLNSLRTSPLVKIETGALVTKILKPRDEVIGVEVFSGGKTEILQGPVIFATGGFAGDATGLLARYRPDLAGFPSTNEAFPGSQTLLADVGAQLLDMEQIQVHPTGFIDLSAPSKVTKFLAAEMLRGEGGILLRQGNRFIDELQTRKVVTDAIVAQPANETEPIKQWDIQFLLDEGVYEAAKAHVEFYLWKGLMRKTTISELAHAQTTLATIRQYCDAVRGHKGDPLGRTSFGHWSLQHPVPESTVYVGSVTPVVHYTMGGAMFSPEAEVLDTNGALIKGLWAAGETTGGLHGANRLGGSSLLECVVFGRIAGRNAGKSAEDGTKTQ